MITLVEIDDSWSAELHQGLAELGLAPGERQSQALLGYLGLLRKWNRAYNLTAVRDATLMVRRQLLDSLSISPWVTRGPVLDVGTGAGLPGIPLAIVHPELRFSLLDTNSKKTRFVQQAVSELGLSNVEVVKARVEALQRPQHYALITSRAFASLSEMVGLTAALLRPDGAWLAMKGTDPADEIAALPPGVAAEVVALNVPGEHARRHLVILRPVQ
jgi:16S rRNA (guanine527-N7)-methyltransferase